MPYYCVERIERALNDVEKPVKGSRVGILGVSYKGGRRPTFRESPGTCGSSRSSDSEARFSPTTTGFVPALPELGLQNRPLEEVVDSDVVVLVTAHPGIDHRALVDEANLFVDLRGTTSRAASRGSGPPLTGG